MVEICSCRTIGAPLTIDFEAVSGISRDGDFLIVDSQVINFTDQPFMIRKELLLELCGYASTHRKKRTLNGFQVLELNLNCRWWRKHHFRVAVGEGCFTHNRFDDSFRSDHAAFNAAIAGQTQA